MIYWIVGIFVLMLNTGIKVCVLSTRLLYRYTYISNFLSSFFIAFLFRLNFNGKGRREEKRTFRMRIVSASLACTPVTLLYIILSSRSIYLRSFFRGPNYVMLQIE